jgi:uncharacterized membrane protein YccC
MFSKYIDYRGISLALSAFFPMLVYYLITRDDIVLYLGLISISLVITKDKLHLNLFHGFCHYLAMILAFSILYFSYSYKILFVFLTSLLALFSILITQKGAKLRTLGNYIFIPAVYIGCELRISLAAERVFDEYFHFVKLSLLCLFVHFIIHFLFHEKQKEDFGLPDANWKRPSFIILISVAISTSVALLLNLSHLQWAIWSSASIILTSFDQTKEKLKSRVEGLLIGLPLGLLAITILPENKIIYIIAVVAVFLSLIAFKNYLLAFTTRCFFVVIAASASHAAIEASEARIENVLLGGLIGIACSYLFRVKS